MKLKTYGQIGIEAQVASVCQMTFATRQRQWPVVTICCFAICSSFSFVACNLLLLRRQIVVIKP